MRKRVCGFIGRKEQASSAKRNLFMLEIQDDVIGKMTDDYVIFIFKNILLKL
jgi:hypothetical protein